MEHKMTDEECIRDLETVGEYFKQQNGGCEPMCISYAIERLKDLNKQSKAVVEGDTTCN